MPLEECVPPATFRCNRKRMVMIVRVTMHHVNPSQVSLTTTPKAISLSTTGRRRFVLRRDFPRGIECDDSQTSARMEGNTLVVELPITNLPSVLPHAATERKHQEPPAPEKPGRKRKLASNAEAPSATRREARGGRTTPKVAPADAGSVLELAEEATAAEAERREQGLGKMRKAREADEEQSEKLSQRKRAKDAKKQQLLDALRKHKKETKKPREAGAKAAKAAAGATASSKKVSFA